MIWTSIVWVKGVQKLALQKLKQTLVVVMNFLNWFRKVCFADRELRCNRSALLYWFLYSCEPNASLPTNYLQNPWTSPLNLTLSKILKSSGGDCKCLIRNNTSWSSNHMLNSSKSKFVCIYSQGLRYGLLWASSDPTKGCVILHWHSLLTCKLHVPH